LNIKDARTPRILPILVLVVMVLVTPAWGAGPDPVDHSQAAAPDGTPVCAKWVHDRYTTVRGDRRWPTWHPARDPGYGCAFGHEHGSNPRAFRYYGRTHMPAFGPIGAYAGDDEPHNGFKVFLTNDDGHGLAWMMVLHQGSGSPKRGTVRFHSLELWIFRNRDRRLVAHTRVMADFGRELPNCGRARPKGGWRLLPDPGCGSGYEEWTPALNVGGALRARPGFGIQNPITQFDPADPSRVAFNKSRVCGPSDPAGWDSRCKGDKRVVLHPRWRVRNSGGSSAFRTDAYGRRAAAGLLQRVTRRLRVNQGRESGGVDNAFVMERPSDGGIYRPGRGYRSTGFERYGYCVLRSN
jgi:hypothetical protein